MSGDNGAVTVQRTYGRDAAVAGAVALACGIVLSGRTGATTTDVGPLDWVSVVVLPVPLIWRRRSPVVAFWAVVALLWAAGLAGVGSPAAFFVPLTALHAVARYRPPRHVWPAMVGTVLPGYANRLDGESLWAPLIAVTAVTVSTALLGMHQRTRHAYLTALEERARRLEIDRDRRARLAVAEERARIARDMHDIVAHNLAVMVALADGAAATVPADPGRAATVMRQASATGREALADMRRLVGLLRRGDGGARAPQPGFDDIDALVDGVRAAGVRVDVVRDGAPGAWGPGAGLVVYRIVQEALTNTLKHAGPKASAEVRLRYEPGGAELSIVDDGAGRAARDPASAERHGLAGMQERAEFYGGRVDAGPRPPAGWRVRARLRFEATS
jgi:signal transduction histidine kinase